MAQFRSGVSKSIANRRHFGFKRAPAPRGESGMARKSTSLAIVAGDTVELVPERIGGAGLDDLAGQELLVIGATGDGRLLLKGTRTAYASGDQVRRRRPPPTPAAEPEPGPRVVPDGEVTPDP